MTNVKDISKQLMGGSLNNFHRKVGLESIEKNNEMQTKVLQGIYSQVDNNYVEKIEESNVIHLDGSGDGVVEVVSVEGNSLVNLWSGNNDIVINKGGQQITSHSNMIKLNTDYTFIYEIYENTCENGYDVAQLGLGTRASGNVDTSPIKKGDKGFFRKKVTSLREDNIYFIFRNYTDSVGILKIRNIIILEGDYTNKPIPSEYFEGLQSSFEEKKVSVNGEDKYEIEILLNNKNFTTPNIKNGMIVGANGGFDNGASLDYCSNINYDKIYPNKQYTLSSNKTVDCIFFYDKDKKYISNLNLQNSNKTLVTPNDCYYIRYRFLIDNKPTWVQLELGNKSTAYTPQLSNKIKVLVKEPLRGIGDIKDRLCINDGKLVIERICSEEIYVGTENFTQHQNHETRMSFRLPTKKNVKNESKVLCNKLNYFPFTELFPSVSTKVGVTSHDVNSLENAYYFINKTDLQSNDLTGFIKLITELYNNGTPLKIIYQLSEPFYEEVLNEYGEPILLEGYQNGTLYIDSVIVPTTTVRYTPKMESYKEVKSVTSNNIMLTDDINENIIPYMMEIDMMILEKEMGLNIINKMEVLDMTSMQKRTFDMLVRLIKGKTLTEQECKDRVVVYLDANKITVEQAEELMLMIAEVYQ